MVVYYPSPPGHGQCSEMKEKNFGKKWWYIISGGVISWCGHIERTRRGYRIVRYTVQGGLPCV